jgi:hypothetical protein
MAVYSRRSQYLCRIARSTRLGVVWNVLATWGYKYLGDGVGVLTARLGSLLDGVCETSLNNKFCGCIYCFISCPYHCWFVGLIPMITKSNFLVKFEGNKHLKKVFSEHFKPKVISKTNELFEINGN